MHAAGLSRLATLALSALAAAALTPHPGHAEGEPNLAAHQGWVTGAAFAADGKTLYTAGAESLLYRAGAVALWNAENGQQVAALAGGHATSVWGIAVSPDNKTLVTSGYDGKVIVWDLGKKQPRATLDKHKGWVRAIAMKADGSHFATGGEDGTIIVWTTADAAEAKNFKAHDAAVYSLAFSPDGTRLASASTDKTAKLWDWNAADKPAELAKFGGHNEAVWAVAFSPDGQTIASGGADRTIRLWNAKGEEQGVLEGHKDWVTGLAINKDGVIASASQDRTAKLWSLAEKKELHTFPGYNSSVWSVAYSVDGQLLATGSHNEGARLFNVGDKSERFPAPTPAAAAAEKK